MLMNPKLELENSITPQDINIRNDPNLLDSYIFEIPSSSTDTPIASMRLMATENHILQYIPAPPKILAGLSKLVAEGNHIYTGSIVSNEPNNGYGLAIWMLSEKLLLEKQKRLIRYITDKSPTFWTTRKLEKVIQYLEADGYANVTLLFSTFAQDTPEYIFLFEEK